MLIISKFKDFYDQSAAYGVDKKIVFKRKQSEISANLDSPFSVKERLRKNYLNNWFWGSPIKYGFVYLAGEAYPFVRISKVDGNGLHDGYLYVYDHNKINELPFKDELEKELKLNNYDIFKNDNYKVKDIEKNLKEMKRDLNNIFKKDLDKILYDNNAVYFRGYLHDDQTGGKVINLKACIHDFLDEIKFGKVLSAPEIFTKIEQYVSSLNNPDNRMVEISDKDKAVAKGHGGKYSFKTPPKK